MAKSGADKRATAAAPAGPQAPAEVAWSYFRWSREPAVGLFSVIPLWLLYEGCRLLLTPSERNGAEILLLQQLDRIGARAHLVFRVAFLCLCVAAAISLVRRQVPWLRVAMVITLEGTIYGLLLGPMAAYLTTSAAHFLATPWGSPLAQNLVGSIGAGIFEELVFRLGLMSALVWLALRAIRAWALPVWLAGVFAVVVSALVFSWFHHFCGEPWHAGRFLFRTMAGLLLGVLMWARGYGVCVYTHSLYNVYFYLNGDGS
ncbi:MAG: CPBP family intramembrane metalloprotease [Planctomycetes bacterium]|nr:CPBP family intramembrane metalloprotease [Planctomycetota bacterium]